MAVTDSPSYAFADDLIKAYPEAKVVLTVRDSGEAWRRSMCDTVLTMAREFATSEKSVLSRLLGLFAPRTWYQPALGLVTKYTELMEVEERGVQMHEEHNAWIKALVPPEKLLVFNSKQGWQPLCDFPEKEVPETSFPFINEKDKFLMTGAAFRDKMIRQTLRNMALCVGIPLLVGLGRYTY